MAVADTPINEDVGVLKDTIKNLEEENSKLQEDNKFLMEVIAAFKENMYNFIGILDTITHRLSNQMLGNADVLKHTSAKLAEGSTMVLDGEGKPKQIKLFQSDSIDFLICNPVQLILGRLSGLRKAMVDLRDRRIAK